MEIDYEKEYAAMVQRARELHETGNELTKRQMEIVCPELRESKDERIRKAILGLSYLDGIEPILTKCSVTRSDIRSYLEKQKEQKPVHFELKAGKWYICHRAFCCRADHLTVKEGERFQCEKDGIVKGFVIKEPEKYFKECSAPAPMEDEQKEQKPPIAGNDFGWIDELKHDLKHPEELDEKVDDVLKQRKGIRALEWSKEDEHRRNDAIYFLESAMRHYADTSEIEKTISWLKSLRSQQKEQDVEKYPEDKSFEDEWKDYYNNSLVSRRPMNKREVAKHFYWFVKKNAWKPSEEQIYSLGTVVKGAGENNVGSVGYNLKELYEQLKKLGVKEDPEYYQHFDHDC